MAKRKSRATTSKPEQRTQDREGRKVCWESYARIGSPRMRALARRVLAEMAAKDAGKG